LGVRESLKAILEASIVEMLFFLAAWYLQLIKSSNYGWISKTFMIILGIAGVIIHKRPREYGLIPKNLKFDLKWSAYTLIIFTLTSISTITTSIFLNHLRPIKLNVIITDLLWFFIFVGFAEELFFRGYIQSRLNEVFNRRFESFLWVRFEWMEGTLITGVIFFGLPHILTATNPFTGRVALTPLIFVITASACFMGVVLGVIREKSGDILLPTVIHGAIDFMTFGVGRLIGLALSNITTGIALFLFFLLIFEGMLRDEA